MTNDHVRHLVADVIGKCQQRCVFCYNPSRKGRIPFGKFKEIIERMPSLERVDIGGGEPFLHPEIFQMARFCLGKGIPTNISTNGLIYPVGISSLHSDFPGAFSLQANLPAAEEKVFDAVTRTRGNFQIFLNNLMRFESESIPLQLRFTICRENAGQMFEAAALGESLNAPVAFYLMVPSRKNKDHMPSGEEVETASMDLLALKLKYYHVDGRLGPHSGSCCPALAASYGFAASSTSCEGTNGSKRYVSQDGIENGCEFLGR